MHPYWISCPQSPNRCVLLQTFWHTRALVLTLSNMRTCWAAESILRYCLLHLLLQLHNSVVQSILKLFIFTCTHTQLLHDLLVTFEIHIWQCLKLNEAFLLLCNKRSLIDQRMNVEFVLLDLWVFLGTFKAWFSCPTGIVTFLFEKYASLTFRRADIDWVEIWLINAGVYTQVRQLHL